MSSKGSTHSSVRSSPRASALAGAVQSGISSISKSLILHHSHRIEVSQASSSPLPSQANSFVAALPGKPNKLTKDRDLLDPVKYAVGIKHSDAVLKLKEANTRIIRCELKLETLSHDYGECHRIAKS